jgi:hypothetical protein
LFGRNQFHASVACPAWAVQCARQEARSEPAAAHSRSNRKQAEVVMWTILPCDFVILATGKAKEARKRPEALACLLVVAHLLLFVAQ